MTAQASDILIYKENEHALVTYPFDAYIKLKGIKFTWTQTDNYAGYLARWEIVEDKLWLIGLAGNLVISDVPPRRAKRIDMQYLFPNQERVFAEWFSGEILLRDGEMLHSVHSGHAQIYERDIYMNFEEGKLISEKVEDNAEFFKKAFRNFLASQNRHIYDFYIRHKENMKSRGQEFKDYNWSFWSDKPGAFF